ncbi:MAG TPA: lysoplasmalogenase [Solimonas sp.]
MLIALAVAVAVSALLAIVADWNETKPRAFLVLKPLTTILIAGIAALAPESEYRTLILLGLGLSLLGDIALMFASNAAFLTGLSSFLLAHLVFMWAFLAGIATWTIPWWAYGFVVYGLLFAAVLLPRAGGLKIPVLLYGAILMGMAITASIRWQGLGGDTGLLALIGASLFVISDSALGARKFLGRYRGAQGVILSTYWSAIALIAASALSVGA